MWEYESTNVIERFFFRLQSITLYGYKWTQDQRIYCMGGEKPNWLHYLKIARQPTGNGSFDFLGKKILLHHKRKYFASATWSRKMSEIKISSIHIFIKVFALKSTRSTCMRCAFVRISRISFFLISPSHFFIFF